MVRIKIEKGGNGEEIEKKMEKIKSVKEDREEKEIDNGDKGKSKGRGKDNMWVYERGTGADAPVH